MDCAPRDGAVLCLSDGKDMVTGAWDGTGWVFYPDPDMGGVDTRCFVPQLWMRVRFASRLPERLPDDAASGETGL